MLTLASRVKLSSAFKAPQRGSSLLKRPLAIKKRFLSSEAQILRSKPSRTRSSASITSNDTNEFLSSQSLSKFGVNVNIKPGTRSSIPASMSATLLSPALQPTSQYEASMVEADMSLSLDSQISDNLKQIHSLASKLPRVPTGIISGNSRTYKPTKISPENVETLEQVVKLLDSLVTQNAKLGASFSLDLLRIVQAFPDQICQWATLHLVDPRSRSAQLLGLGVVHALARLQHPLTIELWDVVQESDLDLPIALYIELCYYFGLPTKSSVVSSANSRYRMLTNAEKAKTLQRVLLRAKATGNSLIIITAWKHTIQGLLAQNDIAGAEREWQALERMGFIPPIDLLQSFIRYYSNHVRQHPEYVEKVAAFHARIKRLNLSPDLNTYSEIMKCYERSLRYKDMDAVLLEMTQEELKNMESSLDEPSPSTVPLTSGIAVKGPRATQLSSYFDIPDFDSEPVWNDRSWKEIEPSEILNAYGRAESPKIADSSTHSSNQVLEQSVASPSNNPTLNAFSYSNNTHSSVSPDVTPIVPSGDVGGLDIAALKARRAAAARGAEGIADLKIGNTEYIGGAQWANTGRKQPAKVVQRINATLGIKPPAGSPRSRPSSSPVVSSEAKATSMQPTGSNIARSKHELHLSSRKQSIVAAWSRAIYAALSLGSLRKAMYLVEEMNNLGLEVNDRICTEFMFFAGKRGNPALLESWWKRLCRITGSNLLRKHYLILMREYLRLNKDSEARGIMKIICEKYGHSDDAYALWLRYYSNRGFNLSVEQTLRQMEINKVQYRVYSISALMEMFAKKGDFDEMFGWFDRLKSETQSHHALDDVYSKCIYHCVAQNHNIENPTSWLANLPAEPKFFSRTLAALLVASGREANLHALDEIADMCKDSNKSTHVLVGLIRAYSLTPPSPKRDHTIVDILKNSGMVKFSLSAPQNDELMRSLDSVAMPIVLLEWAEDLISHASHVAEPTDTFYKLTATASLSIDSPERFTTLATKCFDKYGTVPSTQTTISVIRSVSATRKIDRILYISSSLLALYPSSTQKLLNLIDIELSAVGFPRPASLESPAFVARNNTADAINYLSQRLNPTEVRN